MHKPVIRLAQLAYRSVERAREEVYIFCKLADFIITLVTNMYGGDEPFAPGTAEYDSFMAIYSRIAPLVHKVLGSDEIDAVIRGVLYDSGYPDSDAVLPIK